jgi:subtilase family serine protease
VASSGDVGVAQYPATSPNIVAVGGTSLYLNADNSYNSETTWNNDAGASGGGISRYEYEPAYQTAVQRTGWRTTPDVSFDADPSTGVAVYDSYNNGITAPWSAVGGTSAGAPQWSALIAIANQARSRAGLASLDGPSQTLPLLYHLPTSAFHDITSGSNAGIGYDFVTGRGSPVAFQVVAGLAQPFTVARGGSVLYQLDSTGNLWKYNSIGWGWQVIDTSVHSFSLKRNGHLLVRRQHPRSPLPSLARRFSASSARTSVQSMPAAFSSLALV